MQQLIIILNILILSSFSLQTQTWTRIDVPEFNFKELQYYDFTIDKNNNFWLATLSGLFKFDGEKVIIYDTTNSEIPHNNILSVKFDYDNTLWVGTSENGGAAKLKNDKWTIYDTSNSKFNPRQVWDIAFDQSNNPWFATFAFLWNYINGNWLTIKHQKEFDVIESNVNEVRIDQENNVWFTTQFQGLFKYQNYSNLTQYSHIKPYNYYGLAVDSNNNIWVSNGWFSNQLLFLNTKTNEWSVFDSSNVKIEEYDNEIVFASKRMIDPNNNMWFSAIYGFIRYDIDNNKWELFKIPDSLINDNIGVTFFKVVLGYDNCIYGLSNGAVFRLCDVVSSVATQTETPKITLYPNPTSGLLNIESSDNLLFTHYKIIDIKSKTLIESKLDHQSKFTLEIENLNAGVYYIQLTTSAGEQLEEKFILQ